MRWVGRLDGGTEGRTVDGLAVQVEMTAFAVELTGTVPHRALLAIVRIVHALLFKAYD